MTRTIHTVLGKLDAHNIPWCSWKNNHLLNAVIRGEKDLDLYVPLSSKSEFLKIIYDFGFVEGTNRLTEIPYVAHYYSPSENNNLIHLHVYYKLMTGESHLKDFMLPLECLLIERREKNENSIFVPDHELQRLIYVLRFFLKKSSTIGALVYWREGEDYGREFRSIGCETISANLANVIDRELILRLDRSMDSRIIKCWWLGWRLRQALKPYRRMSAQKAIIRRYTNFLLRLINRYWFKRKKTLTGGGRFIAITGLDGSGKSTIIKQLSQNLKKDFCVRSVHLGKPDPTALTIPVRIILKIKSIIFGQNQGTAHNFQNDDSIGFIQALRFAVLAYERMVLSGKIFKHICNGEVVISDRYPSQSLGKMDSPRIGHNSSNRLIRYLSEFEKNATKK